MSNHFKSSTLFISLLALLALKTALIFFLIQSGAIGLGPDEAQYWTWSRDLSLGYYSKPPGIAWQIFLGTSLFGDTELGVRFPSLVIGFLLPLAIFWMGRKGGISERASFLAATGFALTPMGILSSLFAITDGGSVLFFTLALLSLYQGIYRGKIDYLPAGFFVLAGALFKWVTYYLWIFALPLYLTRKEKDTRFFLAVALSLLGLIPSLIWNLGHGFVTFLHVYYQAGSKGDLPPNKEWISFKSFADFFGAEAALVSPLLFFLLLISLGGLLIKPKSFERAPAFLGFSSLATLAVFSLLSLFMKIQGNWCDFIYPASFLFLAHFWDSSKGRALIVSGTALSLILTGYVLALPFMGESPLALSYKRNPLKHNLGWNAFDKVLLDSGYDPKKHFLFAPKYQTVSLLSFYGPEKKKAYFFNLFGTRLNQFSFWKGMTEERKGQSGYFVVVENAPHLEEERKRVGSTLNSLKPYFQKVSFRGEHPLYTMHGETAKSAFLFFAEGFKGEEPHPPKKY